MRTYPVSHIPLFLFLLTGFGFSQNTTSPVSSSLRLPPAHLSLVPPHVLHGCLDSLDTASLTQGLTALASQSGAFEISTNTKGFLRLSVDSSSGLCHLNAFVQEEDVLLESHRLLAPGEKVSVSSWDGLLTELSRSWLARKSARLEVSTTPSGIDVYLSGKFAGKTPLTLASLMPGTVPLHLIASGWNDIRDTLRLEGGALLHRDYALTRSQAWLDSVHRAEIAHRRDSIWTAARSTPTQALPDLFARLARISLPAGRQSVAVLPFQSSGTKSGGYDPGVMAAEYGVAYFTKNPRFTVVERDGLNWLLKEQALALSGAVSDSGAAVAGRLVAARYLVTGTVTTTGRTQSFAARLVDVETGEIVSAAVATVGNDGLEELYRTAIGERGQLSGSLYRSAVGPGWGQFYTGHPVHGGVALGAALASLGFVGWSYADYLSKDDDYKKFRNHDVSTVVPGESADQWLARAEHARSARNDAATQINVSLAVLGGVWVANLVDAGILGYQESRRIKAEYFSWAPTSVEARPDGVRLSWRF